MIELLFTTTDKPISRMIRYMTREPVSHVAIRIANLVIHSSVTGPELRTYQYFAYHYKIVHKVTISNRWTPYDITDLFTKYDRKLYDYWALAYLGLRYAALRFIGLKLPKANLWAVSGMYTCTEFVTKIVFGKEDSLITPYKLYLKVRDAYAFENRNQQKDF